MHEASAHEAVLDVADGGDPAAPGGAVTVALCGGWDHAGPCATPHHTRCSPTAQGLVVRTVFLATPQAAGAVHRSIAAALAAGVQAGPDGRVSTWRLVAEHPSEPTDDELAVAHGWDVPPTERRA